MSELDEEWTEEAPARRRGIPRWLWVTCGCGCLVTALLVGVLAFFAYRTFGDANDPEVQWPRLRETLAFEERPEGVSIFGARVLGMRQFALTDEEHGLVATVQHWPSLDPSQMGQVFRESGGTLPFGIAEPQDPEAREVRVQGREVRALAYGSIRGSTTSPGIRIDLSRGDGFRMVDLMRRAGSEPIADEEIESFLAPFDVWEE